jgi:hypothetical protein
MIDCRAECHRRPSMRPHWRRHRYTSDRGESRPESGKGPWRERDLGESVGEKGQPQYCGISRIWNLDPREI